MERMVAMPRIPKRQCRHIGCGVLVEKGKNEGYCNKHKRSNKHIKKMYNYRWSIARKNYLLEHPLCIKCQEKNIIVAAGVVDHIIPHQGNQRLFWDRNNWQALCIKCHNIKSAKEGKSYDR